MTLMATGVGAVTVGSRTPQGSILDIAEVHDGVPWDGVGLIESFNCIGVDVDPTDCTTFTGQSKRWDAPSFGDGAQFTIQSGVSCKPFGFDASDSRLTAAFEAMEAEGVSVGLHDTLLVGGDDLTPAGGAVSPEQALAILEGAGVRGYAGTPVIHAGPGLVSLWATDRAVVKVGNHLETLLGTQIAVSVGNESKTGGVVDANQYAFVTGAVVLWRGGVVHTNTINTSNNDMVALYERTYTAAIDCLLAKVNVQVYA